MKLKRSLRGRAAGFIRKGILDGRFDAALWGVPVESGVESPRWSASFYWKGVGGEPERFCKLYDRAYSRSRKLTLQKIWKHRSAADLNEARFISRRNYTIRHESKDARAYRILQESLAPRYPELS